MDEAAPALLMRMWGRPGPVGVRREVKREATDSGRETSRGMICTVQVGAREAMDALQTRRGASRRAVRMRVLAPARAKYSATLCVGS
jgi:hypothetical protein